jgi:hypothetical protein
MVLPKLNQIANVARIQSRLLLNRTSFRSLSSVSSSQSAVHLDTVRPADRQIFPKLVTVEQSLALQPDADRRLTLRGWISSTVKLKKKIGFFHLTDGLSNEKIQVVLTQSAIDRYEVNQFTSDARLTLNCSSLTLRLQFTIRSSLRICGDL